MNSKKLWHSFAVILTYLLLASLIATGGSRLCDLLHAKWGVPFGVGVALWIASLVFYLARDQHVSFISLSLFTNALGAGLFIAAFIVGKSIALDFALLPILALSISALYLFLMMLLSVPKLKHKIWYVVICFVLWMTGSIFFGSWLCPHILRLSALQTPNESDVFLVFFFILLGFLSLGSLLPADNFFELLGAMVIPALVATFFILVIVLLCLAGCDDCDCGDGCGECCDCGDCSGGQYNSTAYGKRSKTQTMAGMSEYK